MSHETNAKFEFGDAKPAISEIPAIALVQEGQVMRDGAEKYGPYNWRENGVDLRTYYNAAQRHLLAMYDGQWLDPESRLPHAAHVKACMSIILDAASLGQLTLNGPVLPGTIGGADPLPPTVPADSAWQPEAGRTHKGGE